MVIESLIVTVALSSLNKMLGLSIEVGSRLGLVTAVTADSSLEVVVLALAADPASIREVEAVLLACVRAADAVWQHMSLGLVFLGGALAARLPFLGLLLFLLILAPLLGSCVELIFAIGG